MSILNRLVTLRRREHAATVELIEGLVTCQRTRAHVDAGYRSVFHLLVERLDYSPAAASRRFAAMRCVARAPVSLDLLRAHRTSLSALAKIANALDDATDPDGLVRSIDGKSLDEVDAIVAEQRPVERPRERVRAVAVKRPARVSTGRTLWGSSAPEGKADAPKNGGRGVTARSASVERCEPEAGEPEPRVALTFTLSRDDHAAFERVRTKLGRTRPRRLSIEETIVALVRAHETAKPKRRRTKPNTKKPNTKKPNTKNKPTRHVPTATRDAVFERDGGRCTFVAPDGTRCTATHALQIDHVHPFALGGQHEPANLRVLCGAHNRRRAEMTFGRPKTR